MTISWIVSLKTLIMNTADSCSPRPKDRNLILRLRCRPQRRWRLCWGLDMVTIRVSLTLRSSLGLSFCLLCLPCSSFLSCRSDFYGGCFSPRGLLLNCLSFLLHIEEKNLLNELYKVAAQISPNEVTQKHAGLANAQVSQAAP